MRQGRCSACKLLAIVVAMVAVTISFTGCGAASVRLTYDNGELHNGNDTTIIHNGLNVKTTNNESIDTAKTASADSGDANREDTDVSDEYEHYAALNDLGYKYQLGFEVECDYDKAIECYREAAEYGIPEAMTNLGYCYERGLGVEIDYDRALELYRQGAALGDSTAMNNLGWCYEQGLGVKQDYGTAYEWYSLSAQNGNTTGYENMMFLESNGLVK